MNLVRHELGFSQTEKRFPDQGHLPRHLLARGQRARRRSTEVLGTSFPGAPGWEAELRALFAAYVEAKQRQNVLDYDDLLLYWAQMMAEPAIAADVGGALRSRAGRRVPGHQPPAGLDPAGAEAGRPRAHRGRRRRAVDLLVPRRDGAQHPRLSRRSSRPPAAIVTLERNYRSTQPILAAANAVIELAERALHQEPVVRPRRRRAAAAGHRARRGRAGALRRRARCWRTARRGIALKAQAVLFRASHHSAPLEIELDPPQHPVREVRRPQVPRGRARQGRARRAALGREPARPRRRLPRAAAAARRRAGDRRRGCSTASASADRAPRSAPSRRRPRPPRTGRPSPMPSRLVRGRAAGWPAELDLRAALVRAASRAHPRRCRRARRPTSRSSSRSPSSYPTRERFLTELTLDPPDATSDEAGVPLLDEDYLILSTIHSAKGQEWKSVFVLNVVDGCIPSDLATGTQRRDRGGAPAALRRDDPRQGPPAPDRAAALLRASAGAAAATATSTRRARASFPRRSSIASRAAPGRRPVRAARARRQRRACRSISVPGCARCGDDRSSRYACGGQPIGCARCTSLAIDRMRGSSKRGATICKPTGRPSRVRPAGTLPAGRLTSVIRNAGAIQST